MPRSSEDETSEPIGKLQAAENSIFASRWERFTPYIAEYWGTLVVTATFLCNVDVGHGIDPSFRSICHAFMVVGMVSATKHVTGSSLNPSVSLALALAGRQKIRTAGFLCIAQILGAITAVAMCTKAGIAKDVTLGPILGHNWFQVALLETLYATMMCIVYLNCAASTKNNPKGDQNGFVGLAYGLCYLASHNAATGVCKTVTNSAISIALIVWGQSDSVSFGQGVGYFFYDLLGAFLAAGAFRVVRPHEFLSGSSEIEDNILESAPLAAEFTGTFFVVLTQICTKMSKLVEHDMGPQAFGTAAAVISMVYACSLLAQASPAASDSPNMAASDADAARDDDSATDPEMPPLIPVSPKPLPEPKRAPKLSALQQLRNRARGRGRDGRLGGRGRGRGGAAKALPKKFPRLALKDLPPIFAGAGALGAGPLQTVEFGKRAGDLAAALDKITSPALAGLAEDPEPELPKKRSRRYSLEGSLEEIEAGSM
ncbi:NIP1-1 [Symbiodinium necroappetens]|uniref:NIP1-1 protein n=1 Tax=Symbiodinium necroappetens TaxID=1628268 RepID=A0A812PV76_9DINO|nr:NIP1-1 [Symbiodinium necroappetens]